MRLSDSSGCRFHPQFPHLAVKSGCALRCPSVCCPGIPGLVQRWLCRSKWGLQHSEGRGDACHPLFLTYILPLACPFLSHRDGHEDHLGKCLSPRDGCASMFFSNWLEPKEGRNHEFSPAACGTFFPLSFCHTDKQSLNSLNKAVSQRPHLSDYHEGSSAFHRLT